MHCRVESVSVLNRSAPNRQSSRRADQRIVHLLPSLRLYGSVLLFLSVTGSVLAAEEAFKCEQSAPAAQVRIDYRDSPVVEDGSRNVQQLNTLIGKGPDTNHNVYGLTRAVPDFKVAVAPQYIDDVSGGVCVVPNFWLVIGFSQLIVYVANEINDDCSRLVIRAHEYEHVNTSKNFLRASSGMLRGFYTNQPLEARYYVSRAAAMANVRPWVESLLAPRLTGLTEDLRRAQAEIDTPAVYERVKSGLRACGRR